MQVDDEWSVAGPRGFRWWLKDFAQELWVSEAFQSRDHWVARLMSSTVIATDVVCDEAAAEKLSLFNTYEATLSALVLEEDGTLRLVASQIIHDGTLWFACDQFSLATALQAADAQAKGVRLAEFFGGSCAASDHPTLGPRAEMDELGTIVRHLVETAGAGASRWAGAEMQGALETLEGCSVLANGDGEGVTAEFPDFDRTALLQMGTDTRHPQVGAGLHVTMKRWYSLAEKTDAISAMLLNRLEAAGETVHDFIGAWCVSPKPRASLTFNVFYPNILHQQGMGSLIALKMANRAEWLSALFDKRSRTERWSGIVPAMFRDLSDFREH